MRIQSNYGKSCNGSRNALERWNVTFDINSSTTFGFFLRNQWKGRCLFRDNILISTCRAHLTSVFLIGNRKDLKPPIPSECFINLFRTYLHRLWPRKCVSKLKSDDDLDQVAPLAFVSSPKVTSSEIKRSFTTRRCSSRKVKITKLNLDLMTLR